MEGKNLEINNLARVEEEKIVKKVKEMKKFLYLKDKKDKRVEINEKIFKIGEELKKNYPDFENIYLFHIMSSSSIGREECTRFDFPGEDSIVKRLEALVKEYEAK